MKESRRSRHVNIPVFIPHLGCPHTCVFCNQRTISGVRDFDPESVVDIIESALSTVPTDADCEIAFFGGSFTGIDRALMVRLLDIAERYVASGRVERIRCSTRPDYIDSEVLDILDRYHMGTVELGIQSMSDKVLTASERGHTSGDTRRAVSMLRERGYRVGGQMMVGLPSATVGDETDCARFIAETCCEARVYPTIVFGDTALCAMMKNGGYRPLSVDEAAERTADVLEILDAAGVNVLRVGLCDSENLHGSEYAAGPNHPSIGELAASILFMRAIERGLDGIDAANAADVRGKEIMVYVPAGATSKAVGQKGINKQRIKEKYEIVCVRFREDAALRGYSVKIETV